MIRPAELANVSRAHGDLGRVAYDTIHDRVRMDPASGLGYQSFFLNWVQNTVNTRRDVPELNQLQLHRPELRARRVEQPSSTKSGRTPHACAWACARGSLARGPRGRVSLKLV